MKAWIVNHHVCSKIAWVLIIYDFPRSQADTWHKKLHRFYRSWLGLAKSAEPSILYRSKYNFGVNFKHLGDMRDQLQVVKWHTMKYSSDPNARQLHSHLLRRDRLGHVGKGRKNTYRMRLE
jgi:hypothetical protein